MIDVLYPESGHVPKELDDVISDAPRRARAREREKRGQSQLCFFRELEGNRQRTTYEWMEHGLFPALQEFCKSLIIPANA